MWDDVAKRLKHVENFPIFGVLKENKVSSGGAVAAAWEGGERTCRTLWKQETIFSSVLKNLGVSTAFFSGKWNWAQIYRSMNLAVCSFKGGRATIPKARVEFKHLKRRMGLEWKEDWLTSFPCQQKKTLWFFSFKSVIHYWQFTEKEEGGGG